MGESEERRKKKFFENLFGQTQGVSTNDMLEVILQLVLEEMNQTLCKILDLT